LNCHKVTQLLSAYMDGELTGVDHVAIHHHLGQCLPCKQEYEGLLKLKRLLGRMRLQEPRAELKHEILHHIGLAGATHEAGLILRLREIHERLHNAIPTAPIVALGAGLAVLGMIMTVRVTEEDLKLAPAPSTGISSVARLPGESATGDGIARMGISTVGFETSYPLTVQSSLRTDSVRPSIQDVLDRGSTPRFP
jgi:predicted anti-sigma-YlaC factor YlaD